MTMKTATASPTPAPAEAFGQPQGGLASFAEASAEAVGAGLQG
jgi:protoporphyrinogen oxidase